MSLIIFLLFLLMFRTSLARPPVPYVPSVFENFHMEIEPLDGEQMGTRAVVSDLSEYLLNEYKSVSHGF